MERRTCPACQGRKYLDEARLHFCGRCGMSGMIPAVEGFLPGMGAAVRGGCPYCSSGPGEAHGDGCRFHGQVPPMEQQAHHEQADGP